MIWPRTWYMLTDFLTDTPKPVLVPWIFHCSSPESQKYLEKYNLLHTPWKSLVFQLRLSCLPLQGLKAVFLGSGIWPKYSVRFGKMQDILTRKGILLFNPGSRIRQSLGTGCGIFFLYIGNSANHTFEQQILINQARCTSSGVSFQTKLSSVPC